MNAKQKIREYLREQLVNRRDTAAIDDNESLFVSGRLDSFSMMNLVIYLEDNYQVDFSQLEFDVSLVDSINAIASLINDYP